MRDYYEQLWERLPERLDPPDLSLRTAFARASVHPGERVLDLGCGDGALTGTLLDAAGAAGHHGTVAGADVAEAALRRARARYPDLEFVRVPFDGPLPFGDGSFDVVWASEVIEHVADTAAWLSEVRRVLVPRGRLALTTPDHGRLRLAIGGIGRYSEPLGDHLHLYTAASLRTVLTELGFDVQRLRADGGPPLLRRLLLALAAR
ncbi:MAG TPA: methyltransferase domain-containing protein [Solirubrobacteraceae bacterium]|nr:methyltransferase domain-containing protein [Solirubrobacteraceae bacterium]